MLKNAVRRPRFRQRILNRNAPKRPGVLQITLSFGTAKKILEFLLRSSPRLPPDAVQQEHALRPTLKPWVEAIDRMLKEDTRLPKKLQTTAMRIFHKLRQEHGYPGCYNAVQEYVHDARSAANRSTKPSRKSKKKTHFEPAVPGKKADSPIAPAPQERETLKAQPSRNYRPSQSSSTPRMIPSAAYRLSQRPHRHCEPEELAIEWMRAVQQGAIPIPALAQELTKVPLPELDALQSAAAKGDLWMRNKSVAVLGYLRGISCDSICSFLHICPTSVFRWWKLFRKGGTNALFTRRPRSDIKASKDEIQQAVFTLLHSPPASHGFNRTTWKMADLQTVLSEDYGPISPQVIRTIIKNAGWKWRHARIVLTSNDPEYRAKVEAIKKILSELREDEAFFSIDEYGPFAIKQKGGVKQIPPGEQYVVPQWQKSKGWLILTAALELSRNQVSHFYSRKKNTDEMIKMADHLRTQYRTCSIVYLSWDAASWHLSKDLAAHLDKINQQALAEGFPIIKTAPLPACAQFLNVIESVFSGMAKAIIHNSDYPSVDAAMEAIDRYFRERNEYFSQHPRRAGKKLWGKERVPSLFSEGQNCKDPMYQYPFG